MDNSQNILYPVVIPFIYDDVSDFSNGVAAAALNGKWSVIDKTGKEIEAFLGNASIYGKTNDNHRLLSTYYKDQNESAGVDIDYGDNQQDACCTFRDKAGKVIYQCNMEARGFSEGLAAVGFCDRKWEPYRRAYDAKNIRWGFIDNTGKEVIPLIYHFAFDFIEGLAAVMQSSKWGFINMSGRKVTPFRYCSVESFSNGSALVKLKNKFGFVDKKGKEAVSPQFDKARSFCENMAAVMLNGKWGFIEKPGRC